MRVELAERVLDAAATDDDEVAATAGGDIADEFGDVTLVARRRVFGMDFGFEFDQLGIAGGLEEFADADFDGAGGVVFALGVAFGGGVDNFKGGGGIAGDFDGELEHA